MTRRRGAVRLFLRALGPGVITSAADDDPAGITTYSIAGAQLGAGLLWLAPLTWPLMAAVQNTCARVGMVTGGGLMDALGRKFSRPLLLLAALALFCANTFNVGGRRSRRGDGTASSVSEPPQTRSRRVDWTSAWERSSAT